MTAIIVISIVVAALILFYVTCFIANKIVSKKIYVKRGDGSNSIRYLLPSDFPNLEVKKDYFINNKKARLSVYEYKLKGTNPKALVLFSHGIGSGHFYSLSIINYLCERGLMVVAYDQYASGTSEGKRIESMTQGAIDVKYAVKYIESHYDLPFYVMGHSWGGYSAAQALRYSKKIEKCLSIAGLDSEAGMIEGPKLIKPLARFMVRLCGATKYGKYAYYTQLGAFKKTSAKVLYLQGKEDLTVTPDKTGYVYQKKLKNKKNVKIVMLDKKGHAPMVTYESQQAQISVMRQFGMLGENLVPLEVFVDFNKNNVPDMDVYKMIGDFFVN